MKTSPTYANKIEGSVIEQMIGHYLESLEIQGLSPKSIGLYRNALRRFQCFLGEPKCLQEISPGDLESYRLSLVEQAVTPASMNIYLRSVKKWFCWLMGQHVLFVDPAARLAIPPAPRRLLPVPSEEEVARLLAQPDTASPFGLRDRALLETAYSTGARREELIGLKISDIDLDQGLARVMGKGDKERMVPLGTEAQVWLKRYLTKVRPHLMGEDDAQGPLWISSRQRPLEYSAMAAIFKRHARRAGLADTLSWHSLRRACVTHMLRRGAHPQQLQQLLGHSCMKHLGQYLRMTIGDIKTTHAQSKPGQ